MDYFVLVSVLAYAQFAALGSISFSSRLCLVSLFTSLHSVKSLELTGIVQVFFKLSFPQSL